MLHTSIYPYTYADRSAVHRIAADSAFFGDPVEAFLEDRQLYCDIAYAYYTDIEPQHGWVAVGEGSVIGFLMGCTDTAAQPQRWMRYVLPTVLKQSLRGRYEIGQRTRNYAIALAGARLNRRFPPVDLRQYPAHLHINVDERWRGHGLGRRLMEAYLEQLRHLGVPGVHLKTTDRNLAACHLYETLGFRLLAARPTRLWQHLRLLDDVVENRAYGLRLE